jgi:hypothetical protein
MAPCSPRMKTRREPPCRAEPRFCPPTDSSPHLVLSPSLVSSRARTPEVAGDPASVVAELSSSPRPAERHTHRAAPILHMNRAGMPGMDTMVVIFLRSIRASFCLAAVVAAGRSGHLPPTWRDHVHCTGPGRGGEGRRHTAAGSLTSVLAMGVCGRAGQRTRARLNAHGSATAANG